MSKKKYVVDDRRPSLMPRIGSAAIAVGSLASVAAFSSTGDLSMVAAVQETLNTGVESEGAVSDSASAQSVQESDPAAEGEQAPLESGSTELTTTKAVSSSSLSGGSTAELTPLGPSVSPSPVPAANGTKEPESVTTTTPTPTTLPSEPSAVPTTTPAPNLDLVVLPSLPSSGNTSSPTPWSGGGGSGSGTVVGSPSSPGSGNTSSPTPGGEDEDSSWGGGEDEDSSWGGGEDEDR